MEFTTVVAKSPVDKTQVPRPVAALNFKATEREHIVVNVPRVVVQRSDTMPKINPN